MKTQAPAEYADRRWNPVTGCRAEFGCWDRCWARDRAKRHLENPTVANRERYGGFRPAFWPERLREPSAWRQPKRIATCFMGDLFVGGVLRHWQRLVVQMAIECERHDFLLLTKRPEEMARFWEEETPTFCAAAEAIEMGKPLYTASERQLWPPGNVWCGVSVCTQDDADRRLPVIQDMGRVPWVSVEPILQRITLRRWLGGIRWVVVGGETGLKKRDYDRGWVADLYCECKEAGVAFWDKRDVLGMGLKTWPIAA